MGRLATSAVCAGPIYIYIYMALQPYIMKRTAKVPIWASILAPIVLAFVIPFWGVFLAPPLLPVVCAYKRHLEQGSRKASEFDYALRRARILQILELSIETGG
ncbi:MAG: hypothetical protein DMG40_01285 [Acidobacteria bacterium]|nr:MAG: hypothetical protein DMG40_01285 [Acidobacteriota bacterium]